MIGVKPPHLISLVCGTALLACSTLPRDSAQFRTISSAPPIDSLSRVIGEGMNQLREKKIVSEEGDYWVMPAYLGQHYASQYYLLAKWLGKENSLLNESTLLQQILQTQLTDGSWLALSDANLKSATTIDPSVYHYWALKVLKKNFPEKKAEIDSALERGKKYILAQGGLDQSILFTRIILALFGNFPWDSIPMIPLEIMRSPQKDWTINRFSQWTIPHLKPIAYLRHHRLTRELGPEYNLDELFLKGSKNLKKKKHLPLIDHLGHGADRVFKNTRHLVEDILLHEQHPRGSWGAYTLSTLFTIAVLQDYSAHATGMSDETRELYRSKIDRGFDFVETLYFKTGTSSYQGVLDDCSYWDTILTIRALRENGAPPNDYLGAAQTIAKQQQPNGGIPFGYDFWSYVDIDDTTEYVLAVHGIPGFESSVERAKQFILSFQNKDHGWGTFDKDNVGNWLLRAATRKVSDSADLFDESNGDMTGHSLEVLGTLGYRVGEHPFLQSAIGFLKKIRNPASRSWNSRWAVNHLFGTSAVISGLHAVGVPPSDDLIHGGVRWIKSVQNADGGFGETTDSYTNLSLIGKGVSTASQTAWALMALVDAGEGDSTAALSAVQFLIRQMESDGRWSDSSVTGTGHPGLIYMVYPSYPMTFPLIALAKYARFVCQKEELSAHSFCKAYR